PQSITDWCRGGRVSSVVREVLTAPALFRRANMGGGKAIILRVCANSRQARKSPTMDKSLFTIYLGPRRHLFGMG
ncbi:MAG: hypothetical protein O9327_15070, partial [Polaromonas sp.]|nr:hypothetical protein [Polaromonas sp.]